MVRPRQEKRTHEPIEGRTGRPAASTQARTVFKAVVIRECLEPGVSIAAVAPLQGLNATMLRK